MKKWEQFELDCLRYLYDKYNKYADFEAAGGSDSTSSDIRVLTHNNSEFFIEVKESPAQCGQFVLLPDDKHGHFSYSELNATPLNKYSQSIITYMNDNYNTYKNAGTMGVEIKFPSCEKICTSWILEHYKQKYVNLIITNNYIIFPINDISKAFNISGTYRVKKSGSSSVGITSKDIVLKTIQNMKLNNFKSLFNNGHLDIFTSDEIDKNTFKCSGNTYMFSKRTNNYEVRKLSNTYNANVIFSIKLKENYTGFNNEQLIADFFSK